MELLDRYLQAVRFWLPRKQQDDIIAELGDDLRSQIEERESSLGRQLNEDELVALLKQAGHPLWVAGRYQKQQALIGPVLFPLYSFVLKIVALGYLVPWFLTWIVLTVFVPSASRSQSRSDSDWPLGFIMDHHCYHFRHRHTGLCHPGTGSISRECVAAMGPAQAASHLPPQRARLTRGIRLRSGLQHRLHRVVVLTFALWTRDVWPHCGLFLAEPCSSRLVSSRDRADVHYRVAAMRQPLASAVDLVSRRRYASFRFYRALFSFVALAKFHPYLDSMQGPLI